MSDIVERARLRNMPWGHLELIDKLADEIKRLRQVCRDQAGVELSEENDRLIAEIERLTAELTTAEFDRLSNEAEIERLQEAWHGRCVVIDERDAEIERLTATIAEHEARYEALDSWHSDLRAEIKQLKNELAKAQFQRNDRPMIREIIRALILEIKTLRLELRQAQVMQVKNDK